MSTQVTEIIEQAFRESGLKAVHQNITRDEWDEALARLNSIISSAIQNEVGGQLNDWKIGDHGEEYDPLLVYSPNEEERPPVNSRLIWTVEAATTIYFPPDPRDGARMAFIDPYNLASTYNATLDGNGRTIEGASTVTQNDNTAHEWLYRADTGNWALCASLTGADAMPLPPEFDDYFITLLAQRINPRYGVSMTPETVEMLKKMRGRIRGRYRQTGDVELERALLNRSIYYGVNFGKGNP